jgi:hypothetical protein
MVLEKEQISKSKTHGPKYLKRHEIEAFVLAPQCLEMNIGMRKY